MSEKQKRVTYQVLDMSCVSCARIVKKQLGKQSGVDDIKVNEILNIFYIDYEPDKISEEELEKIIKRTGYKAIKLRSMKDSH
jgi:Cu+-exporting ATPase